MDDVELLRSIFDATPDALWLMGLDGEVLHANQAMADLVGCRLEDLPHTPVALFTDDQGRLDFEQHLQQMREGHPGAQNEEVLIVRLDGRRVWTLVSWAPVRDTGGEVVGYLHRLAEYTERRRLLDELQQRERELREAHRIARLGSWNWEVATDTLTWSPELSDVFAVDPEALAATWDDAFARFHPDDRDGVRSLVLDAMRQRDTFQWQARMLSVAGGVRWMRGRGEVERDDDGAVARLHGTIQDISDQQAADEQADEATARLQLLQKFAEAANRSTTLADALVRTATVITDYGRWFPVCVFTRTERGGPLTVLELPEPAAADLPRPDPALAEATWESREVLITPLPDPRNPRNDRSLVTLPVRSGRGLACVIQLVTDVSQPDVATWSMMRQVSDQLSLVAERERISQQLAVARDEAMAASRHKSDFLATMSHEIRTPMNGVIGLTDLLLATDLDGQQQRLADGLRGAGLTLLALINDILDLSKIESGKLELEVTDFDVRTVVDETTMILAGRAQDKGLELVVDVSPDVPRTLLGDPVRLGQVLTNLGSNAVKFTERGEVVIEVRLDEPLEPEDDEVVLRVEVRDTGIGIADDDLDGLFDAFTQADRSTTRQHGGTGLGLAISQQLVEGMGGRIGVRSRPGAGSAFWFTVRLGATANHHDAPVLSAQPLRRRRVLVVDDNPTAGSYVVRQLEVWNLEATLAHSAEEALTVLGEAADSTTPYDLALVDLDMPGTDGLELGRRIGADPSLGHVDLVLIAGEGAVADDDLTGAGFRSRATKPVRASELYDAMLDAATADAPPVVQPRHRPMTRTHLGLHVLVVEDNAVNQIVATGLLENLGCRVETVGNGAEAVDAVAGGHGYDVVLMDCRMPILDGFDATRAIRAEEATRGGHVPIIAMTASALPGERDRCLASGMDDFLTKPVDPVQLASTLGRLASGSPGSGVRASRSSTTAARDVPSPLRAAAAPEPVDEVVLDPERVEMLNELVKDGTSFFERTRMSFLARIDGALAQVSIAAQDGDAERTANDAHQLRGSALNLGLVRVGLAAEAVEELGRSGDLTGVDELLAALRSAVTEGVEALIAADAG